MRTRCASRPAPRRAPKLPAHHKYVQRQASAQMRPEPTSRPQHSCAGLQAARTTSLGPTRITEHDTGVMPESTFRSGCRPDAQDHPPASLALYASSGVGLSRCCQTGTRPGPGPPLIRAQDRISFSDLDNIYLLDTDCHRCCHCFALTLPSAPKPHNVIRCDVVPVLIKPSRLQLCSSLVAL